MWEGGASKSGIMIQSIHLVGIVLAITIGLSIPFGLPQIFLVDNPNYAAPHDASAAKKMNESSSPNHEDGKAIKEGVKSKGIGKMSF